MARARDAARDKAKEMYLASNGEMKIKDIAAELGKGEGTVRGWKNKDAWDDELNGTLQTNERNAPNEKGSSDSEVTSVSKRKGIGNPNPQNQFTKRNSAAVTHGFYAKYLPPALKVIIEDAKDLTIADRLYFQIESKFAALVQLHNIMFVESRDDTLNEQTGWTDGKVTGATYKVAYAYEQYAEYVKTEARLTSEWRSVVKQFLEVTDQDDERRFKLEKMELDIARSHVALEKETGGGDEYEDDGFIDALKGVEVKWDE